MSLDHVRIASGSDLSAESGPSAVRRKYAISEPGLSAGISSMESGEESEWHHHGSETTVFFMMSGSLRVEYGSDPMKSVTASKGDFGVVRAGVSHREIAEGPEPIQAIVVRFGQDVDARALEGGPPDMG
ncbi:MAG: cupin domain-containing protein [Acidimicrobiia bacterium]